MKLIIQREIERQIAEVVFQPGPFKETGVTLFGEKSGNDFVVLGIAGPGPDATHEELHYSGNNDYATMIFEDLKKSNPNLQYIGELHLHPYGMIWLSHGDRETIKEVLKDYTEFIAGVMQLGRRLRFYPYYFSKEKPDGERMEVQREGQTHRSSGFRCRRKRRH